MYIDLSITLCLMKNLIILHLLLSVFSQVGTTLQVYFLTFFIDKVIVELKS